MAAMIIPKATRMKTMPLRIGGSVVAVARTIRRRSDVWMLSQLGKC